MGNIFSSLRRKFNRRRSRSLAAGSSQGAGAAYLYDSVLQEVTEKSLLEDASKLGLRTRKIRRKDQFWKSPHERLAHIQPLIYKTAFSGDFGIGEITNLCQRFQGDDSDSEASDDSQTLEDRLRNLGVEEDERLSREDEGVAGVNQDTTKDAIQEEDFFNRVVDEDPDLDEIPRPRTPDIDIDEDEEHIHQFPDFVTPFLNKDVRIRLQFNKAVRSTFESTYKPTEPVHLWRNLKHIDGRFLCHPLQNRIKIMLEESHGSRRGGGGMIRRSRPLFPRAIIFNTEAEAIGLYVAGKEFTLLLAPPPGGVRRMEDGLVLYAVGTYIRYLDTDPNFIMVWRARILEEHEPL